MPLSTISLQTYPTATPFLAKMRPLLEANEARNGLMLGLALRAETDPHFYGKAGVGSRTACRAATYPCLPSLVRFS